MNKPQESFLWQPTQECVDESIELATEQRLDGDLDSTNTLLAVLCGQVKRLCDILEGGKRDDEKTT